MGVTIKKNIAQRIELEKQVISNYTIEENIINTELSMVKSSISENEITINLINDEKYDIIELELRNESIRLQKKYKYNPDRDWWLKTQIRK